MKEKFRFLFFLTLLWRGKWTTIWYLFYNCKNIYHSVFVLLFIFSFSVRWMFHVVLSLFFLFFATFFFFVYLFCNGIVFRSNTICFPSSKPFTIVLMQWKIDFITIKWFDSVGIKRINLMEVRIIHEENACSYRMSPGSIWNLIR